MPSLSAAARAMIASALADAPHGRRTAEARRLADVYGVSPSTIYRCARRGGPQRPRAPARPEYRAWTRIAVRAAHRAPGDPVPLDVALEACVEAGDLPPEAAAMPVQTAYRLRREMGLVRRNRRTARLNADYPMQAIQTDGSTSQHLRVVRALPDGDWLLKLYRRPWTARGYKNKPLGPDRERLQVYGLWDMCTGYTVARYTVARGESSLDALEFLCWALGAEHGDARIPLHGVPDHVWYDQGPLFKSAAAADLLDRLDITPIPGAPYNKDRQGGVERSWRTRWTRFERALFLRGVDEIRLSELNVRLLEYEIRMNDRRPSRTPVAGRRVSRTAAWTALVNGRPADNPLRRLPPDPIATLAREGDRRVSSQGVVQWGGREFEVDGWSDRWVKVREAVRGDGDRLLVEEIRTDGRDPERRYATPLERRPYGEIRTAPATALDRLLAEDAPAPGTADVYAPRPGAGAGNVAPMRSRTAPAAALDNPLDADRFPDLEAAMEAFARLYPYPVSAANRAALADRIAEAGCAKATVSELACRLLALPADRGETA